MEKTNTVSASSRPVRVRCSGALERSDNKLWGCHVRLLPAAAARLTEGPSRRVICTFDGKERIQCAVLFYRTGVPVIAVNTALQKKLGKTFGDTVELLLEPDSSTYGLPVPKELTEVFRQDREGKKLFHALTPGKQRTLLYIIGKLKDTDRRVVASLVVLRHLKENNGVINYRRLSIMLKDPQTFR